MGQRCNSHSYVKHTRHWKSIWTTRNYLSTKTALLKNSKNVLTFWSSRLITTKTPVDKRHWRQLCTAGLAALALQQCRPIRCSVIADIPKGFWTERTMGCVHGDKKQPHYGYAHGGFWATFGSHTCSSTKKQPRKLQQPTELFLKCNLSVGRMKLICWERNKYQSKFPLACRLIPNWARGSTPSVLRAASCSARDQHLAGCTLTSSTALGTYPRGLQGLVLPATL